MNEKETRKKVIRELLLSADRKGMKELVSYLDKKDFWNCPASSKFHGNYDGGLVDHTMNVYNLFWKHLEVFNINFPKSSQVICSFLHDLCKMGAYVSKEYPSGINGKNYVWNNNHKQGHALLSLERIEKFITMTNEEKEVIKFHMGAYGSKEFLGFSKGEYTIQEMVEVFNTNKVAKLFYFCDDMAAQFVDEEYNGV